MEALVMLKPAALSKNRAEPTTSDKAACIFLLMIFTAFLGWLAENIVRLISKGIIDNRFHVLPFIFPYGLAFLAMHLVLGNPDDIGFFGRKILKKKNKFTKLYSNLLYIIIVCIAVFVGELAVGNGYEAITGAALWDYSELPLHLTKYVCLPSALGYGIGAYAVMKFVFYPLYKRLLKEGNFTVVRAIDMTLGTLVVLDSVSMILITIITKIPPIYWAIRF